MKNLLLSSLIAMPGLAHAEMTFLRTVYSCDNGTEVAATYVNAGNDSGIVLVLEGKQVALTTQEAASGAKYAPASGIEGYVWWEHHGEVMFEKQGKAESDDTPIATCIEKK